MSSASAWMMTQRSLSDLEKRVKAENESRNMDRTQLDIGPGLGSPRHGSGRRPHMLGELQGTPTRQRRALDLPVSCMAQPTVSKDSGETESKLQEIMKMNGILNINGKKYQTDIKDLEHLGELGNGTCGHVVKMLHKPSQTVIAVKQMRRSGNTEENKRIIMDLDVVLKSHDCPYIVQCLGCFITDSDVWICMELMATCFDKLLKRLRKAVPEEMLGKVTFATVKALNYLKDVHGVIHRDVKPSNILLDEKGNVKLCDFGISGRLVDSKAKTRSAGCAAYMAPERIDPPDPSKPDYDIRADVWSLGVTLVELATGVFPYRDCKTDFEVLTKVLQEEPPKLPADQPFTPEFNNFVTCCLTKNYKHRPKYKKLLEHPFIKKHDRSANAEMAEWFARAMLQCEGNVTNNNSPVRKLTPPSPSPRRPSPLRNAHNRSLSETGNRLPPDPGSRLLSDAGSRLQSDVGGRLAPSEGRNWPPPDSGNRPPPFQRNTPLPQHAFWRVPPPAQPWDATKVVGSGFLGSPVTGRKRLPPESPQVQLHHQSPHHHLGNTSPLVLQRFYHQQSQHSNANHHVLSYPPQPHSLPLYHTPQPITAEPSKPTPPEEPTTVVGGVKKRFSTYFKLYLGGGGDSRRNASPPVAPAHLAPSSQSPEPPPRLGYRGLSEGTGVTNSSMGLRRTFLDHSPVRRTLAEGSPSLSRRYISPSPPQPPPRRVSESTSVPGSPQHLRVEHVRARFHYTPEPHRRLYDGPDFQDR